MKSFIGFNKKIFGMKFPWNLWVGMLIVVNMGGGLFFIRTLEGRLALACLLKLTNLYVGLPLLWLGWRRYGSQVLLQWKIWAKHRGHALILSAAEQNEHWWSVGGTLAPHWGQLTCAAILLGCGSVKTVLQRQRACVPGGLPVTS